MQNIYLINTFFEYLNRIMKPISSNMIFIIYTISLNSYFVFIKSMKCLENPIMFIQIKCEGAWCPWGAQRRNGERRESDGAWTGVNFGSIEANRRREEWRIESRLIEGIGDEGEEEIWERGRTGEGQNKDSSANSGKKEYTRYFLDVWVQILLWSRTFCLKLKFNNEVSETINYSCKKTYVDIFLYL